MQQPPPPSQSQQCGGSISLDEAVNHVACSTVSDDADSGNSGSASPKEGVTFSAGALNEDGQRREQPQQQGGRGGDKNRDPLMSEQLVVVDDDAMGLTAPEDTIRAHRPGSAIEAHRVATARSAAAASCGGIGGTKRVFNIHVDATGCASSLADVLGGGALLESEASRRGGLLGQGRPGR
jgi:hypothetical protein